MFSLMLGTFPKAFSQAATSQGIFPRGNFPIEGKLPLGKLSFGKMYIWEVAAWEIFTWEVSIGKMPIGISFRLMKINFLIIKYPKKIFAHSFLLSNRFFDFFPLQSEILRYCGIQLLFK